MGSRYLTDLAQVCRSLGVIVHEENGWQTRSRSSGGYNSGLPNHVMCHHTASNPSSDGQSDVDYMCYGSDNRPVANLYLSRKGEIWVMAAGATNTNGKGHDYWGGGVPNDSMNTYAIGIEAANNGVGEVWPTVQQNVYAMLVAALCSYYHISNSHVRAHFEWAPDRKIDPAGQSKYATGGNKWNMDEFRADCAYTQPPTPQPMPPPVTGVKVRKMFLVIVTDAKTPYAQYVSDGIFYRHLDSNAAVDALKVYMAGLGLPTKQNNATKAQVDALGVYIGDNGQIGAVNPYL